MTMQHAMHADPLHPTDGTGNLLPKGSRKERGRTGGGAGLLHLRLVLALRLFQPARQSQWNLCERAKRFRSMSEPGKVFAYGKEGASPETADDGNSARERRAASHRRAPQGHPPCSLARPRLPQSVSCGLFAVERMYQAHKR